MRLAVIGPSQNYCALTFGQNGYTAFYGATYLSPEFVGQTAGRVVGSVSLEWNF
jgi:hypothetical protein